MLHYQPSRLSYWCMYKWMYFCERYTYLQGECGLYLELYFTEKHKYANI